MTYADDPQRLARLLRDLAQALETSGIDRSGSTPERHLMDDARNAAHELDPPAPRTGPDFGATFNGGRSRRHRSARGPL